MQGWIIPHAPCSTNRAKRLSDCMLHVQFWGVCWQTESNRCQRVRLIKKTLTDYITHAHARAHISRQSSVFDDRYMRKKVKYYWAWSALLNCILVWTFFSFCFVSFAVFFRYTKSRSLFRFPKYWAITKQGANLFFSPFNTRTPNISGQCRSFVHNTRNFCSVRLTRISASAFALRGKPSTLLPLFNWTVS